MIRFDLRDFERMARHLRAAQDQIPFALGQALNDAAFKTRDHFIRDTWARHVEVRNRNFLRNALRIERATKRSLAVAITNEGAPAGQRGHLALHAKGGLKQARGRLAVPVERIANRRGAKGIPARLRPSALPDSFVKGNALYQRTTKGRKPALRLMYGLTTQARIRPAVPFQRDFETVMRREIATAFPKRIMAAMQRRR